MTDFGGVLGLLGGVAGLGLHVLVMRVNVTRSTPSEEEIVTTGTVVAFDLDKVDLNGHPTVEFVTLEGDSIRFRDKLVWRRLACGSAINVAYVAEDPARARALKPRYQSWLYRWWSVLTLWGFWISGWLIALSR